MSLSNTFPSIQSLKKAAKQMALTKDIQLSQALDLIANDYGFTHWALLVKYFNSIRISNIESFWQTFLPGEMLLLSAPEGAGKLSFALNLSAIALQKNIPVKYFSMHVTASFIFERLSKIVDLNLVRDWQRRKCLVIEENSVDPETLKKEIKSTSPDTLLIIDYLQAIKSDSDSESYHNFLQEIKSIVQQHASRMLILSQVNQEYSFDSLDYIVGGRSLGRHFSHAIHIEPQQVEDKEQRSIILLKSIHYQKQKSLLQFNKENYRFE